MSKTQTTERDEAFGRDDIQRWKRRCFAAYVQWGKGDDQRWICQHVHNTAKGAIACGTAFDKTREEES